MTQILKLDEATRTLFYMANGREAGQDPYFGHAYRIGLDGMDAVSLTPEDADHAVTVSPSGGYLIDTYSRVDVPPVVVLRCGQTGAVLMKLDEADISALLATGWKPPVAIKVKAADGVTDLYGHMFRPHGFDPAKKYPVVNNAYPVRFVTFSFCGPLPAQSPTCRQG